MDVAAPSADVASLLPSAARSPVESRRQPAVSRRAQPRNGRSQRSHPSMLPLALTFVHGRMRTPSANPSGPRPTRDLSASGTASTGHGARVMSAVSTLRRRSRRGRRLVAGSHDHEIGRHRAGGGGDRLGGRSVSATNDMQRGVDSARAQRQRLGAQLGQQLVLVLQHGAPAASPRAGGRCGRRAARRCSPRRGQRLRD